MTPISLFLSFPAACSKRNSQPVALDDGADASITYPIDVDFNGGSLTVSYLEGGLAEDGLFIRDDGTGPGQIGISGNTILYGGVIIGTLSGGTGGSDLVINFTTSAATLAAVSSLTRAIVYDNSGGDTPTAGDRVLEFTLKDGSEDSLPMETVSRSSFDDGGNRITLTSGTHAFEDGDAVIYSVPDQPEFLASQVDVEFVNGEAVDTDSNQIYIDGHAFSTLFGTEVVYFTRPGSEVGPSDRPIQLTTPDSNGFTELQEGAHYYVKAVDTDFVKIYESEIDAFFGVNALDVDFDAAENNALLHFLVKPEDLPVDGLSAGQVYYVDQISDTEFDVYSDAALTVPVIFNTEGVTIGGSHAFEKIIQAATAEVTISVASVNDAPVAVDDALLTDEDSLLFSPLVGNLITGAGGAAADFDVEGDSLSISAINGDAALVGGVINLGSGLSLVVEADGSFTLSAADPVALNALASGEIAGGVIQYTLSDGDASDVGSASFVVNGMDEAGSAGNDLVTGTNSAEFLAGGAGNDRIVALDGDDIVFGQEGNDMIDGGKGDDTAILSGALEDYSILITPAKVIIRDLVGNEGTDLLTDVEFAYFYESGKTVDLTTGAIISV